MAGAARASQGVAATRLRIPVEAPFELDLVARSHGWFDLPPFHLEDGVLTTACWIVGRPTDVVLRQTARGLAVRGMRRGGWTDGSRAQLRRTVRRMLGLDRSLGPFWEQCRRVPAVQWAARRGAGRLLAAPSLFEDLAKILLTTNCTWECTRLMVTRLVDRLGSAAPSGRKAFPTASRCAGRSEAFYREQVRAGYRAARLRELARRLAGAAGGRLASRLVDPATPLSARRQWLTDLPGFGPYAVGQGLRLLGCHEDLALDSWCRTRWMELMGRRKLPTETGIRRALHGFDGNRGLALWVWLTAGWHGEESPRWKNVR